LSESLLDVDATGWAGVFAAVVTGAFGLLAVLIQQFKKSNSEDHEVVQGILRVIHKTQQRTEDKLDKVSDRLTTHIENHKN
jgi:hypothetical protein